MIRYKGHPIYRVAVPAPENRWYSRELLFDGVLNQTIEIKRIESNVELSKQRDKLNNMDSICAKHGLIKGLTISRSRGLPTRFFLQKHFHKSCG
jgi:hypothetical protein